MERMFRWLDEFKASNLVRAAFGEPYEAGGRTLIPVSRVMYGLGGGGAGEQAQEKGGGAGQGGSSKPVAVVSVGPEGVQVHEIVSGTAITLTGLAVGALALLLIYKLLSRWMGRGSGVAGE
jgi:uncharacterized spore protein YtfJ